MTDGEIIERVFNSVGGPPSAEAYVRCALMEAIRMTREDAFVEAHRGGENTGTTPEDRLWIEAARQVVNRMAAFDEEKRKDFTELLQDLSAEIGFRNVREVEEIKRTMVEFLASQTIGGIRWHKPKEPE